MPNTPLTPPNPRSPALLHQDTSYAWSTGFGAHPRSKLSMATMLNKGMGCLHSEQVSISANHPSTNKVTNFVFFGVFSPLVCFDVWMFVCQPPNQPACLPARQPTCLHTCQPSRQPTCLPTTDTPDRTRPLGIPAGEPLQLPEEPTWPNTGSHRTIGNYCVRATSAAKRDNIRHQKMSPHGGGKLISVQEHKISTSKCARPTI